MNKITIATLIVASTIATSFVSAAPSCNAPTCGGGWPSVKFNYTTNQMEMVPQCFPHTWLENFYKGNIFDIYINQKICQEQRAIDFKL